MNNIKVYSKTEDKTEKLKIKKKFKDIMQEIYNLGKTEIDYIYHIKNNSYSRFGVYDLFDTLYKYYQNSKKEPLILKTDFKDEAALWTNMNEFFFNMDIYDIGCYQSRSLLHTKDKTKDKTKEKKYLEEGETLKQLYYYKDDLQSLDINIGVLWSDFSEHKRLYIYDS
jgi:hypothetical protein